MARQTKSGIDYFSHDVDMLQDKKIKIIKAKHGLMGYAIYIRLLEEVYRENGYYLQIDEDFNILFSDDNNIDYNVYILILNDCIEKGLFNKKMYDKHSILTSERIQSNYFSATERRKSVSFYKEYLIADPLQHYNIEKLNVYINSLNVNIGTQSKVKGKEKESKEDIDDLFLKLWDLYPNKKGKANVSDKTKKAIYKLGEEEFKLCLDRYVEYVKKNSWLKYQNGSTFFNGGYIDYLDDNYTESNNIPTKSKLNIVNMQGDTTGEYRP